MPRPSYKISYKINEGTSRIVMLRTRLICCLFLLLFASFAANAEAAVPIIVKVSPLANILNIASVLGGTVLDSLPGGDTYLLSVPSLPIVTPLLQLMGVQWIEQNNLLRLPSFTAVGLTPASSAAADWYKYQPAMMLIRSNAAHDYSTGRGIVVADINSRVDYGHPALLGHLTSGYDFVANTRSSAATLNQSSAGFLDDQSSAGFLDDQSSAGFLDQSTAGFLDSMGVSILNDQSSAGFLDGSHPGYSHGTLCAGVIAAVAPDSMIMPLRAFDDNGNADVFTLAKAIRYAAQHGVKVLNMSFGTLTDVKVLREAVQFAQGSNVIVVASAGNNNTANPQYPASYGGVLGSGATDLLDVKVWFSNYGATNVFVDAPGRVISTYPNGQYSIASGTSFSAPAVAGAAALVRSIRTTGVADAISGAAVNIDNKNPGYAHQLGYGRIDVLNAVD
jgi:subtilisin family serine protease